MHAHPVPLFTLDEAGKYRLSHDGLQWILEKGNPAQARPGKDSGFRGTTFVSSQKKFLVRELRRKKVPLSRSAKIKLLMLPVTYRECRKLIEVSGVDDFRRWLERPMKIVRTDTGELILEEVA